MLTKVSALVLLFSSVVAAANQAPGPAQAPAQGYKLQVENFATILWSCASLSQKVFFFRSSGFWQSTVI